MRSLVTAVLYCLRCLYLGPRNLCFFNKKHGYFHYLFLRTEG